MDVDVDEEAWNALQQEQFRRIRDGFMKTGFSRDVAESHARRALEARQRRRARPRRTGSEPTKDELYLEAMRYDIPGRSQMDKQQLLEAVLRHRQQRGASSD